MYRRDMLKGGISALAAAGTSISSLGGDAESGVFVLEVHEGYSAEDYSELAQEWIDVWEGRTAPKLLVLQGCSIHRLG